MTRLRSSLGAPKIVQTVVKRGYRLAMEPDAPISEPTGVADPFGVETYSKVPTVVSEGKY